MSKRYEKNYIRSHFGDIEKFYEYSEKLLQSLLDGGGADYMKLVECFRLGFPLDNLDRFLDSADDGDLEIGILILQEIGQKAREYIDKLASIMHKSIISHKYHGMWVLLEYADEQDQFADWVLLSLVDISVDPSEDLRMKNFQLMFCSKVIHCLSHMSFGQLRGAKQYLQDNIPDSPHLYAIDFYLNNYNNHEKVFELMGSKNSVYVKYAVAMGSRFYKTNPRLLDYVRNIDDDVIQEYLNWIL